MSIEEDIRQKKFTSPYQKAMINLIYTSNWVRDRNRLLFKPFEITEQQYNVLRILRGCYPKGQSGSEIKEVMLDKSPDLTRLINRLLTKKLVIRKLAKGNRRKLAISISDAGLELLKQIDPLLDAQQREWETLTRDEAEQLSAILDKLRS